MFLVTLAALFAALRAPTLSRLLVSRRELDALHVVGIAVGSLCVPIVCAALLASGEGACRPALPAGLAACRWDCSNGRCCLCCLSLASHFPLSVCVAVF